MCRTQLLLGPKFYHSGVSEEAGSVGETSTFDKLHYGKL